MNAVFREENEVPVVSNDAIQAQLTGLHQEIRASEASLNARIDKANEKIDKTNEKIDFVSATLSARIDMVDKSLSARIEAVDKSLSAKIETFNANLCDKIDRMGEKMDAMRKDIFARFDKQDEQIKALDKRVDWVHISVKVVLAILGLCVSAAVILNALRNLGWI